jgi:hypothetical protein
MQNTLTQVEKAFIVNFLANTFNSLTQNNTDSLLEALEPAEAEYYAQSYFIRLQDAQEVLDNLQMLYNTAETEPARFTFTIAQAAQAICSYDTEYRDCITEQLECACTLDLQECYAEFANANCKQTNFATLPARIFNAR